MKALTRSIATIILIIGCLNASLAQDKNQQSTRKTSGYAPINGLKLYYEIYGNGEPIVLLHGSYMAIDMNYDQLIPLLAKTRKVIAIEMQGHGRTADTDRPYSYEGLASDVSELLKYLKIGKADIVGYSLGGTVALETAIKYPGQINNLIFISSVFKYNGWVQDARNIFPTIKPEFFEKTPLKTEYDRLAPQPKHWIDFVNKLSKFDATSFDLGENNVKQLKCPALLIFGDNDGVELSHVAEIYKLIGGGIFADMKGLPKSQLAILAGSTHVGLMGKTTEINSLIEEFLNKKPSNH
nr:alpha/beta hydrolase [Pedobacter kyonggii]